MWCIQSYSGLEAACRHFAFTTLVNGLAIVLCKLRFSYDRLACDTIEKPTREFANRFRLIISTYKFDPGLKYST